MVQNPIATRVRYARRLLVLRRTGFAPLILLAPPGRYQLRSLVLRRTACVAPNLLAVRGRYQFRLPVLRRTAGACDAEDDGGRSGNRRAGIERDILGR